ncbi:hypothetical protein OXYTRIMIC_435 [Oxytricha trifallax]|uniref:Uncharacterized protein n=1 Tax=Oxytricha trifallax TaxID=1172189 RepID=A0A073HZH9_9SPIT|nr:hypothetical protein OXYTRIMIC_435 [Oxytricha trifallax]
MEQIEDLRFREISSKAGGRQIIIEQPQIQQLQHQLQRIQRQSRSSNINIQQNQFQGSPNQGQGGHLFSYQFDQSYNINFRC